MTSRAELRDLWTRGQDLVLGVPLSLVALPIVALGALAVFLEDRSSPLFVQQRAGRGGRPFQILKLRSMVAAPPPPDQVGQVQEGNPYVTWSGAVLRRLKIDELLQLWNVLRGDMSLVGPRPGLVQQVEGFDAFQRRRLEVRPGCTGWAQVSGNVLWSWEDRIRLDVWYIDHWSPVLDMRILFETVAVILRGEQVEPRRVEEARAHEHRSVRRGAE